MLEGRKERERKNETRGGGISRAGSHYINFTEGYISKLAGWSLLRDRRSEKRIGCIVLSFFDRGHVIESGKEIEK